MLSGIPIKFDINFDICLACVMQMSLVTDSPQSSSSDDFAAYLDEALNSSDPSPEEEIEDDHDDAESGRYFLCCFLISLNIEYDIRSIQASTSQEPPLI